MQTSSGLHRNGTKPSSIKMNVKDVYLTEKTEGDEKYLYIFIASPRYSVTIPTVLTKGCCVLETGQALLTHSEAGCTEIFIQDLFNDNSIVVLKACL